jgi:hypothetical protein
VAADVFGGGAKKFCARLVATVEKGRPAVLWCGHEHSVDGRGPQGCARGPDEAQAERARRERDNVEDTATFVVARARVAGVDEWEAERVAQVGAEAARRRDEHRLAGAAAVARIRGRGESVSEIAALAQTTETEVRAYLKLAGAAAAQAQGGGAEDAVDAPGALGLGGVDASGNVGGDV